MKRKNVKKKVITMLMSVVLSLSCFINVYASDVLTYDTDAGKIVTEEEAVLIEEKLEKINQLELKRNRLSEKIAVAAAKSYSNYNEIRAEIELINEQIEVLKKEMYELGATTPSDKMLEKLVSSKARWSHPSEIKKLLEDDYEVFAYSVSGKNIKQQYHIMLKPKNDPDFTQNGSILVYGENATNGINKNKLTNTAISLAAEWLIEGIGGSCEEIFNIVPWEFLLDAIESPKPVLCTDIDSMTGQYGMISNVKFVFVLQDNGYWQYALSTSRVFYTYELRARVLVNNERWEFYSVAYADNVKISGRYDQATKDAEAAITEDGMARNTCIKEWTWDYKKNVDGKVTRIKLVKLYLPAPDSVLNLIYK